MVRHLFAPAAALLAGILPLATATQAADPLPAKAAKGDAQSQTTEAARLRLVAEGVEYLISKGQAEDGSFSGQTGAGVTSLCTTALLRSGRSPNDPAVAKSLAYLEKLVRPDGGIYPENSTNKNYETCLAVVCFKEANRNGKYDRVLANADKFLKGLQWDESEGQTPASVNYGGAGYGRKNRPDLSNTSFLMEALIAAGNGPEDEAVKKALVFVSRCQNLESEHNTSPFAAKINDGGFYYTVANGGESFANDGSEEGGSLRSYGSMTYAGLKSMIYAGLKPDDPRVKAATEWLRKHYDFSTNPGMKDAGLFYYLHTAAKTLHALGEDRFKDAKGVEHDWRADMVGQLAKLQNPNGSWTNKNNRWLEADANLVTGYALLSLSYCGPK